MKKHIQDTHAIQERVQDKKIIRFLPHPSQMLNYWKKVK